MHPALSVIFFTTATGAGYGFLALLGIFGASGLLPSDRWMGLSGLIVALGLITTGLLSSTFHLGHPERAWRAFTQWRSSWLSREGVASVLTYIPALLLGVGWVVFQDVSGFWAVMGVLAAVLSWLTVACTAMIYRSLRPIHQWHNDFTVPSYIVLSLMSGAVLMSALTKLFSIDNGYIQGLTVITLAIGWALKSAYWNFNKKSKGLPTVNSAIGVDAGRVNVLEAPHTSDNYLLKEMGFKVARKHAERLRLLSHVMGFALPLLFSLIALFTTGATAVIASVLAWALCSLGILVERWLFFAEAKHSVTLYYGEQTV
ncbi:dimethyl sulfoxide reductase anchor subunit family protein [Varunaivibrio sulfuroxidans]|uniref:DMSO reductase anchor subunit n=1 Tax=Varunaivibrio sulfuroxidans TaxID=1773489 RepID=A0A4V2UNQ3_9PROT|nr:DmsC/YnfH family molybdoenzyme membrane anchor subunit [Varunaivibrio sulfuroxidans]TCS62931.1 DMSO reductase anchor subunit [Varunaivibrio sulfuroxidans]WES31993.1 dimethyl sulfoxide reductase anchor subunit [Varunaivibrio sulfuroxidans]